MDERSLRMVFKGIENDHTFSSFEAFCEWSAGKAKKGFTVYKVNVNKPHSPENSYWYYSQKRQEDVDSPICESCDQDMLVCHTIGCQKYREYFVKNWNKNICRVKNPEVNTQKIFRYEHPDLVREGIVFEGTGSV